jgi:hypothetical protein
VTGQSTIVNNNVYTALNDRYQLLSYIMSISSCAEVANIILNTTFLSLLLKFIKHNINYQANQPLRPTNNNNNHPNLIQQTQQLLSSSRYLAANSLAILLRYATYIQPPSVRTREEHIVHTLVTLLREASPSSSAASALSNNNNNNNNNLTSTSTPMMKMDIKLRRKAVSALGEMIFYISAQEEEQTTTTTNNNNNQSDNINDSNNNNNIIKWTLSSQAIDYLIYTIRDDPDEIIRHYCAKVIKSSIIIVVY